MGQQRPERHQVLVERVVVGPLDAQLADVSDVVRGEVSEQNRLGTETAVSATLVSMTTGRPRSESSPPAAEPVDQVHIVLVLELAHTSTNVASDIIQVPAPPILWDHREEQVDQFIGGGCPGLAGPASILRNVFRASGDCAMSANIARPFLIFRRMVPGSCDSPKS